MGYAKSRVALRARREATPNELYDENYFQDDTNKVSFNDNL